MGDKLWPTFKNSQCQLNRLLKVPLGSLLLHNELTDNTRSTLHVLNIVVYTLHSDFYQYTSLETMTHVFSSHRTFETHFPRQSASTEAIFSST